MTAALPVHGADLHRSLPGATHQVLNQVEDLVDIDAFDGDAVASFALDEYQAGWASERARALAASVWSADTQYAARLSHRNPPQLRTVDRTGHRIDAVEFHPAYHQLMSTAYRAGVHALPWAPEAVTAGTGGHVARAVLSYLWNQVDGGTACPTGMTYAAVPILTDAPGLGLWADRAAALDYDPTFAPVEHKKSAHIGFAMTEKQGGSDLRANQTTAVPETSRRGPGEAYLLTGHKWFFSVPAPGGCPATASPPGRWTPRACRWRSGHPGPVQFGFEPDPPGPGPLCERSEKRRGHERRLLHRGHHRGRPGMFLYPPVPP